MKSYIAVKNQQQDILEALEEAERHEAEVTEANILSILEEINKVKCVMEREAAKKQTKKENNNKEKEEEEEY